MTEPGIRKIIYLVEAYFNQRDYDRFGIRIFEQNGFEVEVWDCTPFIASTEYKKKNESRFDCQNRRLFFSKRSVFDAISNLDPACFVISLIHYSPKTVCIHRGLLRKKIRYCVDTMALPAVDRSNIPLSRRLSQKAKLLKSSIIASKILNLFPARLLQVRPADFILGRGEKFGTSGLVISDKSEIVWAHSYDYDIYLSERGDPETTSPETGVFIDEFKPFHPDYAYSGHKAPVTPEEYYPKLCLFFEFLEKNGFKIIIAAHPRSRYEAFPDYYGARPIIRGGTSRLVRNAGLVIMHTSTAVNFAVLYRKPVIIITTDKYNEGWMEDPTPQWLAGLLGKKAHNLDEPLDMDLRRELQIDEASYRAYRNNYIKKDGTEDAPSWQILADRIKRIR
ncbi:MAG TPA: hypothetical protein PLG94_07335 [Smithellaceae bacterium]|nr:hypothetical protein [Smithellaceae bacterium]